MKTAKEVNGYGGALVYPDTETAAAVASLDDYQAHFILQQMSFQIPQFLALELRAWYERELLRPDCDMAKVEQLAQAHRALSVIVEKRSDQFTYQP